LCCSSPDARYRPHCDTEIDLTHDLWKLYSIDNPVGNGLRSISVSQCGRYLASGDEQHNLVIWDIKSARILRKYKLDNPVIDCIEWSPSKENCLLAATNEDNVYVIQP